MKESERVKGGGMIEVRLCSDSFCIAEERERERDRELLVQHALLAAVFALLY